MKDLNLLVWLTQLGLSVAAPPAILIYLAVWLQKSKDWGSWVIWVAVILGILLAIDGLIVNLRALRRLSRSKKEERQVVSFNDHE